MAANLTFTDIQTRVQNSLRLPTSNTTEATKIAHLINDVYRDIYIKQDWWFLEKRTVLNTVIPYDTGTLTLTNGSTGGTFGTAPGAGLGSFAGRVLIVTGNTTDPGAVYRFATHTAGAGAFVLDAAYTGPDTTDAAFRVYTDRYSMPTDTGKLLRTRNWGAGAPAKIIAPVEMNTLKSWDQATGAPTALCVQDFATTGDPTTARQVEIYPYPDATYRIELTYKQQLNTELSGTTQPLIPDEYRQLLVYGALSRGYPIFLADSERGQVYTALFNDLFNLMAAAHREYNQDRPQIQPADTWRRSQSPRRRGRVSLGSYFDRWPTEL